MHAETLPLGFRVSHMRVRRNAERVCGIRVGGVMPKLVCVNLVA